jgi:succinate dehydrogenase/fumarate reductase cytochrome b subunit
MGLNRNVSLSTALGYKGHGPFLAYIMHRIGGSALFIFFTVYILSLVGVQSMQSLLGNWMFQIILVVFGLFHALNGLRITLMDLQPRWIEYFKTAMSLEWIVYFVLGGFAILTVLRNAFGG